MKKIIYIVVFVMMTAAAAQAKVVEMEGKFNTVHGYHNDIMSFTTVSADFGKIPIPGDYGVFIRVRTKVDGPDDSMRMETFTFFFRPVDGEIIRDGDSLYLVDADGTTRIAEKWFIFWKASPGVSLVKHFQGETGRGSVGVSIQIDDTQLTRKSG